MLLKGQKFLAGDRVPDLARAVVAARDELITRFIKSAICQWKEMSAKNLETLEFLILVLHLLLNQL